MANILRKQTLNSKKGYRNVCLNQISINLENSKFAQKSFQWGVLGQTQPDNNLL